MGLSSEMILAVDVDYRKNYAVAAGLSFESWESAVSASELYEFVKSYGGYEPGQFYKRELPCILNLIGKLSEELSCIVIDGFVELGVEKLDGLGKHLYLALSEEVPVIGVAKNHFKGTPEITKIYRGNSQKPLYITTAGIELEQAKQNIESMHGNHRIPTLLKRVDYLCRHAEYPDKID